MDFLKDFQLPTLGDDADVKVEGFSIKGLINAIIEFINRILRNEEF